jgi:hypothetical protein
VPRRPPVALLALALAGACSATGTTTPKDAASVAPVNGLSADTLLTCRALKGLLPKELASGVRLRTATPLSDSSSAYGDPVIGVRCGVKEGNALDDPYEFDGVTWAMHDTGASRTWTTRGLKVNVAVEIPDAYDGQAEMLGALAKPLTTAQRT